MKGSVGGSTIFESGPKKRKKTSFTKAGPVKVTRGDGTTYTQPAYRSRKEVEAAVSKDQNK